MKRFYDIVIHPKDGKCPLFESGFKDDSDEVDCNSCPYLQYIGTLGGEYYVDCNIDEETK